MSYPNVVSDAGHGGHDAGAINGATGHRESDIVLDFSKRFCEWFLVLTGIDPIQSRPHDVFVTLSGRAGIANDAKLPLISWHCNAFNSSANGVEAFTSPGETASDPLATAMLEAFVAENPNVTPRFDLRDGDPDKEARFTVLTKTKAPAVLFELGFIDSPKDIKFLSDENWRERNAKIQAEVVAKHFGLLKGGSSPIAVGEGDDDSELLDIVNAMQWQIDKLKDQVGRK